MILHFNNAYLLLDAFFLYTQILEESQGPYSRLTHARNVVMHDGACACTTPNLHQPWLYHTNKVLFNQPCFAVWLIATAQTFQKLMEGLCLLHGKNWPKMPITTPTFFFLQSPISVGVWVILEQLSWGCIDELWCHNNQANLTLPTTKVPPPIPPTAYIPIISFMETNCLHEGLCGICPRMMFSCRYTDMSFGYLGTLDV